MLWFHNACFAGLCAQVKEDEGIVSLLEMPSGTGKTVCNMSYFASLLFRTATDGDLPKRIERLFFCTRTLGEMEQATTEAKHVLEAYYAHYARTKGSDYFMKNKHKRITCCAMSSRHQLCVHKDVRDMKKQREQDALCLDLIQPTSGGASSGVHDIEDIGAFECKCSYYTGYQKLIASAEKHDNHILEYLADKWKLRTPVLSVEDLREKGMAEGICPYFLSRYLAQQPHEANIVVLNYQYLLDPAVHSAALCPPGYGSGGGLPTNPYEDFLVRTPCPAPMPSNPHSVVVFDEAHNIDNVCNEALSRFIVLDDVISGTKQLCALKNKLVSIQSKIPQSLFRKNASILLLFRRMLDFLVRTFKTPLKNQPFIVHTLNSFVTTACRDLQLCSFHELSTMYGRYHALLRTLMEHGRTDTVRSGPDALDNGSFLALTTIVDFMALVLTFMTDDDRYNPSFMIVLQQRKGSLHGSESLEASDLQLELICLNPEIIFKQMVVRRYNDIVLTSGTMSPLDMYPKMLGFRANLQQSFEITFHREAVLPIVVSRTITAAKEVFSLTSKMEDRQDANILRGYGLLLIELSRVVPDGMVVFFPSYQYMEIAINFWANDNALGFGTIIDMLLQNKLLFFETSSTNEVDAVMETSFALHNFKVACDCGRGGILFAVARGKLSEGIDFSDQYGRCVVLVGMPFMYHKNPAVLGRMKFLKDTKGISESEFLQFDCMRVASQCVGRAIRNKADYSVLVFADKRFTQPGKFSKLPAWLRHIMTPTGRVPADVTSTDAQKNVRHFFRLIASSTQSGVGVSMLTPDQLHQKQKSIGHPIKTY